MSRRMLAILGLGTIALTYFWIWASVDHIPPYSSALERLAESEVEGFCSGVAFWNDNESGGPRDDPVPAEECRFENSTKDTEVNLRVVIFQFCTGAKVAGYNGDVRKGCMDYIVAREMWPTYDGRLTSKFNDAYPWPGGAFGMELDFGEEAGRVGDRLKTDRFGGAIRP